MSFLHKLWDETLAGPAPENGLGKLRKYNSFSAAAGRSPPMVLVEEEVPVTRSITILRTQSNLRTNTFSDPSSSLPGSPSESLTPRTPLTPETPGGHFKKFTRRKPSTEGSEHRSPTIYDWMIMSALDRC